MKRWSCPNKPDEHPGVNAPGRLRKIDTRRFCLVCSVEVGTLVERVCVSAETKRKAKKEKAKEKAKKQRAAKGAARERRQQEQIAYRREAAFISDVDLNKAIQPFWNALTSALLAVGKKPAQKHPPFVSFHRRGYGGGFSYDAKDRVAVSVKTSLGNALETLLHELGHKAVGNDHHHDGVFNGTVRRAARLLWPSLDLPPSPLPVQWRRGYKLSRHLTAQLVKLQLEDRAALLRPFSGVAGDDVGLTRDEGSGEDGADADDDAGGEAGPSV